MPKKLSEFENDYWSYLKTNPDTDPYSMCEWGASWAFNRAKEIIRSRHWERREDCAEAIEAEQKRLGL